MPGLELRQACVEHRDARTACGPKWSSPSYLSVFSLGLSVPAYGESQQIRRCSMKYHAFCRIALAKHACELYMYCDLRQPTAAGLSG